MANIEESTCDPDAGQSNAERQAIAAEPWLDYLPENQRAEVLQARLQDEVRFEHLEKKARKIWQHPVKEGALLFLGIAVLAYPLSWTTPPIALFVGACTGLIWHVLKAEQLLSIVISMPMFLLLTGLLPGNFFAATFGTVAIGLIAAWLGLQRSMRGY